ncbi:MAG: outer membrane protein assembly factor, partial [Sulfitobacter sp.]
MGITALVGMRRAVVGSVIMCAYAFTANGAEVSLSGVGDDDLRATLRGGSLLIEQTVNEENEASASEILGAAQADYKRLLAVLYDNGYFGASITISVDGREASSISPVQAPAAISRVKILIDKGQKFKFGRALIAPIAEGTTIPEGFAE